MDITYFVHILEYRELQGETNADAFAFHSFTVLGWQDTLSSLQLIGYTSSVF